MPPDCLKPNYQPLAVQQLPLLGALKRMAMSAMPWVHVQIAGVARQLCAAPASALQRSACVGSALSTS